MTAKKIAETSAVASHDADKERAPVKLPVATAEPPPPKPAKRTTTTIRAVCTSEKYADVRQVVVKSLVHLFGTESGVVYSLEKYHGTESGLGIIMRHHVEARMNTRRYEDRINVVLPGKLRLEPAEMEVTEQARRSPRSNVPQVRRPVGLSNFGGTIATLFELRALSVVTTEAAFLQAKKLVVKSEMALADALENWHPMKKLVKPGESHPLIVNYTDEQGQQLLTARLSLAREVENVRQLDRLKSHLKTLRGEYPWLVRVLKDCQVIIEEQMAAQLNRDAIGEVKFAKAMMQAGYETDFHGKPYADYLNDDGEKTK